MDIRLFVSNKKSRFHSSGVLKATAGILASLSVVQSAMAFDINSGNSDIRMSLDTSVKYSLASRTGDASSKVADSSIGPQANTNDGDLNFSKGLISNRLDILTSFDFRYKRSSGFRISAAAWYDDVYHGKNDNPGDLGGALVNSRNSGFDEFTDATTELHGDKAEILDAFVFSNFALGNKSLNVKAGKFTQLYGESLFFGSNGIAAAQTSLDLIKALSVPNSTFQEIMRPVNQVSAQLQVSPELTLGAYYQLEWKKTRLPAAGSYFSFADFVDEGGESLILGPGAVAFRSEDIEPSDSGQGGFQIKYKDGDYEYGFYAAQFHDKMPQFYARPGVNVKTGSVGDYVQVFGENIQTVGLSVATLIGETNVSAEMSFRNNMPLVATGNAVVLPGDTTSDGDDNAAYPVGKTTHLNISAISVLGENALWDGAAFLGEIAYNRVQSITDNKDQLDPIATKSATAIQFLFTPEYFQVSPGVDLQVPIGLGYGVNGRSSVNGALFPSEGGGNLSIGVKADFHRTWQASFNFTHYYGPEGSVVKYGTAVPELSYKNFHGDRDFVSLSLQRSF